MKIKNPKFAFAIRFNPDYSSFEQVIWYDLLVELVARYPKLKVEGINKKKRSSIQKKNPLLTVVEGNEYVEIGEIYTKKRNVIGVGISSKYHISFESLEELTISKACNLYSVPVYDLSKDLDLIIGKLEAYLKQELSVLKPVKVKKEKLDCVNVTYHSNFVRVGNSRVDYDDVETLEKLLGKGYKTTKYKEPKVKTTKYNLKRVILV